MIPEKSKIELWLHEPTILRLMSEKRWPKQMAQQQFTDFMKWLYTATRYKEKYNEDFLMDNLHYLDDVWHIYIIHTKDYFLMSKSLFHEEYIHHNAEHPFISPAISNKILQQQFDALIEDWGMEYIDRVWAYGNDIHDIIHNKGSATY